MKLANRQERLLGAIINEYIKSAEPVGSGLLSNKYFKKLSPATLRNEMTNLVNQAYLSQPHTSAGRLPTAKAYRYYIQHLIKNRKLNQDLKKQLNKMVRAIFKAGRQTKNKNQPTEFTARQQVKNLAKKTAAVLLETVMVAFSPDDFYYTGISNLFSKPEFKDHTLIYNLSAALDNLDQGLRRVFNSRLLSRQEIQILIGPDNPFSDDCSLLLAKYKFKKEVLFGLLGPMRMDYAANLAILEFIKSEIENTG